MYNNTNEIRLEELPEQFVLKTNHGSGFNIIVSNKNEFNLNSTKNQLEEWMRVDYGQMQTEFHYSFIKRKIFAEEYLGKELKNYKFLCYDGEPKFVYLSLKENHFKYRNFYDMEWNLLPFSCLSRPHPTYKYEKPKLFELMKDIARKLSSEFKFVRVDLYEINNEIRLGELTFVPMNAGFHCDDRNHEIELGKYIDTKMRFHDYYIKYLSKIGRYD